MRDIILRAVEKADGWQFVASHSIVKIPGFTEPADVLKMSPVVLAGLVDQLVSQIDASDNFTFESYKSRRCTITNDNPTGVTKGGASAVASHYGETRALNALHAMSDIGFF